ncbi:MAG: hypothetical protein IRZ07_00565 [Microbispora sp.]|nr:hypothetical protein [Microbispora sp.]
MNLSPLPIQKFFGNNGRPLAGGLLFTYEAGTSTKVATYTDASGSIQNTNPIVLDFRGECRLWLDPKQSYKFVLSPPGDTDPPTRPIWTVDDITVAPQAFDNAADDIGSVNNISLIIPQISSPVAFTRVVFKAAHTNTGPTTIQINGGTAHDLTWQTSDAFSGGEIQQNGVYVAIFDGARWQLQGPALFPTQVVSDAEADAGVAPVNFSYSHEYINVKRYGAKGDGVTNDTAAIEKAFAVAREYGGADIVFEHGDFLCDTVVFDFQRGAIIGDGAILRASPSIPTNGAILLSLSGDSTSGASNQSILDGIYGPGVVSVRTANPNFLENLRIVGLRFASNANNVRGIWATGITRGCVIEKCFFEAFENNCIALSGSWSFALKNNFCNGRNNGGRLIELGTASNGAYAGAVVCNAIDVTGNWCGRGARGFHWDRGQGGNVNGNTFEHNLTNVVLVNPRAFSFCGNYMEGETSANMLIGAENGLEFVGDAVISGNQIATSTGIAIQLNAIHNSIIGPNRMSGAVSQQYFILTATPSTQITGNFIEIEQLSSTYVNNTTKLDIALNRDIYERALYRHNFSAVARRARIIKNEDYTFTAADAGASVHHSSGSAHAWTIPAGGASIPNGAKIRCTNGGSGVVTLTRDTGVTLNLYTGSGVSNQNVAMAQGSWADLEKVSANTWDCIGQGLS